MERAERRRHDQGRAFSSRRLLNPAYAAAYAGMARCYALISMEGAPNSRELLAKARLPPHEG